MMVANWREIAAVFSELGVTALVVPPSWASSAVSVGRTVVAFEERWTGGAPSALGDAAGIHRWPSAWPIDAGSDTDGRTSGYLSNT